jgi:hypothetical protein
VGCCHATSKKYPTFPAEEDKEGLTAVDSIFTLGAPLEVVTLLARTCCHAMKNGGRHKMTVLHLACKCNAPLKVVLLLLRTWPSVPKENSLLCQSTPLHLACRHKAPYAVVSLLLSSWPYALTEKDTFGKTPFAVACKHKAPLEVVSLLLSCWPDAIKKKKTVGTAHLLKLHAQMMHHWR